MPAWITDWRPEDEAFWAGGGRRVARRNMITSIACEHIGFSVWTIWSVLVLFLGKNYHVDPAGKFLLTSVPALVGSVLRLPYSYAVVRFGGRDWTVISALLLLIPTVCAAFLIKPGVSYTTLMVLAALTGVGGGNFASSMTNINAFYPQRLKGWALGLNAGIGNLGVATAQLAGLLVLAVFGATHPVVLLGIYIPAIVVVALLAALTMDNLALDGRDDSERVAAPLAPRVAARVAAPLAPLVAARVAAPLAPLVAACGRRQTWIISLLYIGTFGSFIGFSFAFGEVLQVQFPHELAGQAADLPRRAAEITFLGPLLGSLVRPIGGRLADRFGGAAVTFGVFVLMAGGAAAVLVASADRSLGLFITGFVILFTLAGTGNGSTYKLIPEAFRDTPGGDRLTGAVIGIAGAIGAFGGVLVNVAFRESFLTAKNGNDAYIAFIIFYVLCALVTWAVYLRTEPASEAAFSAGT
jgi:NNP family nitrate/nitrite transporter-like MFS transporter